MVTTICSILPISSDPTIHGHATDTWSPTKFTSTSSTGISWTPKNLRTLTNMLPERTSYNIDLVVPAIRAAIVQSRVAHPTVPECTFARCRATLPATIAVSPSNIVITVVSIKGPCHHELFVAVHA